MKTLLKLAFPILMSGGVQFCNVYALNFGEIRDSVRAIVNDSGTTRRRFTNTEVNLWINKAQRIVDEKTLCNYKSYVFDLSAGTTYYALPADYISIRRVTRSYLSLQELSPAALDGRSAEWENQSGLPTYYFTNFSSRTKIGFAPFPLTATDTATIKVEYMAYSSALVNDTDIPFNSYAEFYAFHPLLEYYASAWSCLVDERYEKAKALLELFNVQSELMKERCVMRPNYDPSWVGKR